MSRNKQTRFTLYLIALTGFAASKSNQLMKKCCYSDPFLLYCKILIYFPGDQYCLEIKYLLWSAFGETQYISTFRNDQLVDTTLAAENEINRICFDSFDIENDIIEIRNEGTFYEDYSFEDAHSVGRYPDFNFTEIHISFINGEQINGTQLLFGPNERPYIHLGNFLWCDEYEEYVPAFKIKNETVIESACTGSFIFSIFCFILYKIMK